MPLAVAVVIIVIGTAVFWQHPSWTWWTMSSSWRLRTTLRITPLCCPLQQGCHQLGRRIFCSCPCSIQWSFLVTLMPNSHWCWSGMIWSSSNWTAEASTKDIHFDRQVRKGYESDMVINNCSALLKNPMRKCSRAKMENIGMSLLPLG